MIGEIGRGEEWEICGEGGIGGSGGGGSRRRQLKFPPLGKGRCVCSIKRERTSGGLPRWAGHSSGGGRGGREIKRRWHWLYYRSGEKTFLVVPFNLPRQKTNRPPYAVQYITTADDGTRVCENKKCLTGRTDPTAVI